MIYAVYVEDRLLDIDPAQVIALTFQASDIGSGDLINRKLSFSNQLTVPKTNRNILALGYSNLLNTGNQFAYYKKSVNVTANGITILRGVAMVQSFDGFFHLQIYSLGKDLSIALGNKVLEDLDFGDSPITWDQSYMDSVRDSLLGFCAPLINYGQIDPSLANGTIGDYYLPCVSYKSIITTILENAGYTVSGDFYGNDDYFNRMALTYSRSSWIGTTTFKINEILSDTIKQSDFLTDFLVKFGAYFRFNGSDIEIITLESILNDQANAIDWTSKRANKKHAHEFTWDSWAQVNNFTYPDSGDAATDKEFGGRYKGNGYLTNLNENISASRNVYDSPISGGRFMADGRFNLVTYKVANVLLDVQCATMNVWDSVPSSYDFDNEPDPMLVLLRDAGDSGEAPSIVYNGSARTDHKVGFFQASNAVYTEHDGLRWNTISGSGAGLLDYSYPTIQSILASGVKKVTRSYNLTLMDIYSLDLLTLVFDTDNYFLIQKVKDYVPGRNTEVDLLSVSYQS